MQTKFTFDNDIFTFGPREFDSNENEYAWNIAWEGTHLVRITAPSLTTAKRRLKRWLQLSPDWKVAQDPR
jgi:hypothetical protein